MFEPEMKPVEQEPRGRKAATAKRVRRLGGVARGLAVFAVVVVTVVYAQDKYSLISPGGIAFSDFKGYEDWAVISSARTDERLKVIVGNPTMIKAFKAGVPLNGQPFPDGSMIV